MKERNKVNRLPDEDTAPDRAYGMIMPDPAGKPGGSLTHALDSFSDDYLAYGRPEQTHELPEADVAVPSADDPPDRELHEPA